MSALRRKLERDLRRSKWQFGAVTTMLVLGITFFVGLLGSMDNLRLSVDQPYRDLHFADFTVTFERAPKDIVQVVASVEGVDAVAGRLDFEVPVTFPGRNSDVIAGRIVTVPAPERPAVNDLLVTEGSYLPSSRTETVLVEENFATHHGLGLDDAVEIQTLNGTRDEQIVGIAISPEYLWPARNAWEHMPDVMRRWGVLFMAYETAAHHFGFEDAIDEVAVTVKAGADRATILRDVRSVLEPYRISAVVTREEQPSQVVLDTMVGALDTLSVVFPIFFLIIVSLSTYVLLTRLVHVQRQQIGVLLALGFPRRRILGHYLGFALLVGILGSVLGAVGGYLLALPVTDLFAARISLPLVYKVPHWDTMILGVGLSLVFTSFAGLLPAYRASRESPAATMRGETPKNGAARLRHTGARGSRGRVAWRLPFRDLKRNRVRSGFAIMALGLAGSLIIVPLGFLDTMDGATRTVDQSENFDLSILLYQPVPSNTSRLVESWEEVESAEGVVMLPVTLEGPREEFNVELYGLPANADSYRLFSRQGDRVYVGGSGILLAAIYEKEGLKIGDSVRVGPLTTRVAGFVRAYSNSGFLPIEVVQAASLGPGLVNGLFLRLAPGSAEDVVKDRLYASLPVWSVISKAKSLQDWEDMLRLFYGFIGVIVAFGTALAGAIVFNTVTINVLERNREIATMRTIGMKGSSIARMITVENLLILAVSVVVGSVLGLYLTGYFASLFGGDLFVFDATVYPGTFALSAALLLGALLAAEAPSLRHIQRLDLARVTKERAG